MKDIEQQLRTTLTEIAAHDTPTPDLAERLIANAMTGSRTVLPLRRPRRYIAPLLAAAVALLLAAGILVATKFNAQTPPVTPPPAPTRLPSATPSPSSVVTSGGPQNIPTWISGTVSGSAGLPVGFGPRSTQLLDPSTGFLLGSGPCPTGSDQCGGLYRTQDGGASWTELSALIEPSGGNNGGVNCPVGNSSANTCVQTVHFTDAQHGVVFGDAIALATTDGGVSWRAITWAERTVGSVVQLGDELYALDFDQADGTGKLLRANGKAFVDVTGTGMPRTPRYLTTTAGRLYVVSTSTTTGEDSLASTSDGINWRAEPAPPCASSAFAGRADGTVVVTCLSEPGGAVLADGARTWTQFGGSPVAFDASTSFARITAVDDSRHFSVLVEKGGLESGSRYVWGVTSDGGATWKTLDSDTKLPSPEDSGRLLSENGTVLTAVLTTERLLVVSTDLGLTWSARVLP